MVRTWLKGPDPDFQYYFIISRFCNNIRPAYFIRNILFATFYSQQGNPQHMPIKQQAPWNAIGEAA